jgi:hypothetical protein
VPETGETSAVPVLSAALPRTGNQIRYVVVTLSSGISAAYSPRPEIDAKGVVSRRFTALPLENGVGTGVGPGTGTAATLRVQRGDEPPQIGPFGYRSLTSPGSPTPALRAVAASCRGEAFGNARLNMDNVAAGVTTDAGRAVSEISQISALWCRQVGPHAVMFVGVRLSDGTAFQTDFEDVEEGGGHGFAGQRGWPVPRGRDATYPSYVRLTLLEEKPSEAVRRAVLLFGPGGASADLVRGPAATGPVLVRARLGLDGAGVGSGPDYRLGGREDGLLVVVRDRAGRELERVQVPDKQDVWGTALDGPVQR